MVKPVREERATQKIGQIVRSSALDLDLTGAPGSMLPLLAATALFTRAADDAPAHWLLEDIASLADEFGQLADCAEVRVRLTKVSDDGCAAFHVDNLLLRVLCTYAGKGAQWAAEADVRRAELGLCFCSAAEANAAIVPDAGSVRTMPTGAVAIFKGRLWPGAERRGLVHRSHPVCCGEHARLRLTIDPVGSRYRSSRENPDSRMSLPPMRADPLRKEAEVE